MKPILFDGAYPYSIDNIEQACLLAYEFITGDCRHTWEMAGDPAYPQPRCVKCSAWASHGHSNLALASSRDAWTDLWALMTVPMTVRHDEELTKIINRNGTFMWQAEPLHHLEAALRACGLYERWEAVVQQSGKDS